jgi:hypothetical protein
LSGLRGASVRRARSPSPMLLGELPNELLMLLFSLLRAKDACRLSQAARAWQQRVKEYLAERHHAWRCGVLLLDWAERAVLRVRHRCQQSRQNISMDMHSFVPVPMPTQLLQIMSSSSALERVLLSSQHAVSHVRCCFIPDAAPGNCCGAMVAARSTDDLWEHLKMVHGVDRGSYMVRARALQWRM